jgi:anti-sigma factor (TIGR02949 family)
VSSCAQALSLLDDYLDGELQPSDTRLVRAHLAQCDACATELRRVKGEIETVREHLRQVATPPGLRGRLGAAIRELSSSGLH